MSLPPLPARRPGRRLLEVPDLLVSVLPLALTVLLLIIGFTPILHALSDPNTSWTGFTYQSLVNRLSAYALATRTPGTPAATLERLREQALSSLRNRDEYTELPAVERIGDARLERASALFDQALSPALPRARQGQAQVQALEEAELLNAQAHERIHQVQYRHATQLERLRAALLLAAVMSGALSTALILRSLRLWRAERQALDNQRELLALASHELRRPLQSLLLATDLLRGAVTPEERVRYLGMVEASAAHLSSRADLNRLEAMYGPAGQDTAAPDLTRQDTAEVAAGPDTTGSTHPAGERLEWQQVDLAALLGEFQGGRTHVEAPGGPCWVQADPARLRQIIENLHENALRYSAGPVTLRVGVQGGCPEVQVQDSGPGIDPAEVERLFKPHERGLGAQQAGRPGSGLGLTIAQRLAHAHGAQVSLEAARGGGTVARLRLAAQPTPAR